MSARWEDRWNRAEKFIDGPGTTAMAIGVGLLTLFVALSAFIRLVTP